MPTPRSRAPSFRTSILLVVTALAVAPLLLIGLWLSGGTSRSGEALLRTRLREALAQNANALELGWVRHRSDLLDLGDEFFPLTDDDAVTAAERLEQLQARLATSIGALDPAVASVSLLDAERRLHVQHVRPDAGAAGLFGPPFVARVDVFHARTGSLAGSVEAMLPLQALQRGMPATVPAGGVFTAIDLRTGAVLVPTPFDPELLREELFHWSGEEWLALRHSIAEPAIELIAAAPLTPFTQPFRRAARDGALALLFVALLAGVAASAVTGRLAGSVERLAVAADAVAAGDLERQVAVDGGPEIAGVARAFNTMTANLRVTLRQLAERESLAAVNEFAASLAHEVRNPLSSIQLDLQEVEERLPADSPLRPLQAQALSDVRRLERTVAGALETARSGRVQLGRIDLREPVSSALRTAAGEHEQRGARLIASGFDAPLHVLGDSDALHRVFLNLLRNAAEALPPGGETRVDVDRNGDGVTVRIRDNGSGIDPDALQRVFDAFYTTRPGGTGLGLAIARRIVSAHGGRIGIESQRGVGTTVDVWLPHAT